jgi:hypothetical protein
MRRALVVVLLALAAPILCSCCAFIEMNPNPLGPLTGRWEGLGIYSTGPGDPKEFPFALTLIESNGTFVGAGDIGDGVVALHGTIIDGQITLDAEVFGDVIQLRGELSGDSISGTVHFRGAIGTWQVTRTSD